MPFFIALLALSPYVSNTSAKRMLARDYVVCCPLEMCLLCSKYSLYQYILAHAAKTLPFQGFVGKRRYKSTQENTA